MIKYSRIFITAVLAAFAFNASAQNTSNTSSPYSQFGLGDIEPQLTPQSAGMGGIGVATNVVSSFSTINFLNPASYAMINLTTIDVGVFGSSLKLSRTGQGSENSTNFRLNHLAFAIPVTKKSALSFGLLPYSSVGYNYKQSSPNFGTGLPADTNEVNFTYSGEGGLNKAYLGYGFGIGNLLLGANVSYLFGNVKNYSSTEIPDLYGTQYTRNENNLSVSGFNFDYGAQYMIKMGDKNWLTLGYSGSLNSKLNSQQDRFVTHYINDSEGSPINIDSLINVEGAKSKLQLPMINRFGLSFKAGDKLLIGADYSTGKWSELTIAGTNAGLKNSQTFNVGAQITPNVNKLNNYLALVDYRVGFMYNQTYLNRNNTDINQYAVTFGLGLPLRPSITNTSFYKINVSAEIGKRGTLQNNLVKENFVNIRLGFTINDKWFQRYRFD
ncbi:hypothetical protein EOD41_07955 [Mucilaginibacter limnophilus]|uniref:Aromatic hydrocarbon degradation protein n=1 Tax=Mucilaginibacter limnophilus TaxID=1932778 RepID=A0A3S2UN83_9SPHI|nr:hypothetical protein [Mucilaginibacter limnophilus]RVU01881.1 hypothetical protein EOD41_07955 [Mucilaginibacter limnophilus]